jgi:hypothetical protein
METASQSQLGDARYADYRRSGRHDAEFILADLVADAQRSSSRHR